MSFVARRLNAVIKLGEGTYGLSGATTLNLTDLRMSARITQAGGLYKTEMSLDIYGMPFDLMNQLSTLGNTLYLNTIRANTIQLFAGDTNSVQYSVFQGDIFTACADFQDMPNVVFRIVAQTSNFDSVASAPPKSYSTVVDVAEVLQDYASQLGLSGFKNNGVSVKLTNPYLYVSVLDQAKQIVQAAHISWSINNNVMTIWPTGADNGSEIVYVSPANGLIGYPAYTGQGIAFRTIFNPLLSLGGLVQVQSSLFKPPYKTYPVTALDYQLDAQVPNGQWFCNVQAGSSLTGGAP